MVRRPDLGSAKGALGTVQKDSDSGPRRIRSGVGPIQMENRR